MNPLSEKQRRSSATEREKDLFRSAPLGFLSFAGKSQMLDARSLLRLSKQ